LVGRGIHRKTGYHRRTIVETISTSIWEIIGNTAATKNLATLITCVLDTGHDLVPMGCGHKGSLLRLVIERIANTQFARPFDKCINKRLVTRCVNENA
jgi:hypothetical protein